MARRRRKAKAKRKTSSVVIRRSPRKKRKQYTPEQMEKALETMASGRSTIRDAARKHGVPVTTLHNRVSGRVTHGTKPGPVPYMNSDEEKALGNYLKQCASVGYGKTRKQVLAIAEKVARDKEVLRKDKISEGWWRKFLERQEDLALRKGDNTAHSRMDAVNPDTMKHYFELLKETLTKNDLLNAPHQIYNVDESGVPLDPKALNVVTARGSKKVYTRSTGRKGQVTIVACGNAAGQVIPPMVIFDAKKLCHSWTRGEVPGTSYGLSDKGWITTDLFLGWLTEHFLKHAVSARPLLLLLDGHSTHYNHELIQTAREKGVIMLCLPPHTTHQAQPLDCCVFSPLKLQWRTVCHEFIQKNPGCVITKFNFNSLFSKAWLNALSPVNLISGFQKCGVYPFNALAISVPTEGNQTSSHQCDEPHDNDPAEPATMDATCVVGDELSLAACFSDVAIQEPLCKCSICCCTCKLALLHRFGQQCDDV